MGAQQTSVAILLATYNGEKYIKEQLDSLLDQTFQGFTCYIHDDGSKDRTREIVNQYLTIHSDKFVYVSGAPCGGAKENFLFLLRNVEADIYMFCDQDDVWVKTKVADSLQALRVDDQHMPRCIYTDVKVVDSRLREISPSYYSFTQNDPKKNNYRQLLMGNVCIGCTMMLNRALRDVLFDFKSGSIIMHDWAAALIAATVGEISYHDKATLLYRQHDDNTIGARKKLSVIRKLIRAVANVPEFYKRQVYYRDRPRMIAKDLLQIQKLPEDKRVFLTKLAEISQKNKLKRVQFYIDNDLFRQGTNKVWQLVCV